MYTAPLQPVSFEQIVKGYPDTMLKGIYNTLSHSLRACNSNQIAWQRHMLPVWTSNREILEKEIQYRIKISSPQIS